ncbi:phage portal protein family protein [Escherichia coli]|uniref:phage portal protein family protein n=1 Tax=Escherichia coli TaxID=562 RepID=UPI002FCCE5E8
MPVAFGLAGHQHRLRLNPGRLAGILRNAANGITRDFFILAEEMEERDLHYASVLRTAADGGGY